MTMLSNQMRVASLIMVIAYCTTELISYSAGLIFCHSAYLLSWAYSG